MPEAFYPDFVAILASVLAAGLVIACLILLTLMLSSYGSKVLKQAGLDFITLLAALLGALLDYKQRRQEIEVGGISAKATLEAMQQKSLPQSTEEI